MRTYVFRPAAEGKYPGVVLFSEIFQVTGPIRRMAAMIAGHGYVVAVPEVYHELEPAGTSWLTINREPKRVTRTNTRKNCRPTMRMGAR